jgi:hypothetical protein
MSAKEFLCGASLQSQRLSEKASLSQATAGWAVGNKKVVVLRLEFPDQLGTAPTERECREMMEYADRALRTNSYGVFSLDWTVSAAIRMPKPESELGNLAEIETVAWQLAGDGGVRRDDFDLDVIVGLRQLGSGSYGNIGTRGIMMNRAAANSAIVHELGHNLGLLHARSWVGYNDSMSGAGETREYGDAFDIMGSGDRSFNSWAKRRLGWLLAESVRDVTNSQTIDIAFHETEVLQGGAPCALRIPAGDKVYWVDCQLPTAQSPQMENAILVRWAPPVQSTASTYLLDMRPETVLSTTDASLLVGRTFSDQRRSVHITPIKKLPNGFRVQVNLGDFPTNRPPELTLSVPDVLQLEIGAAFEVAAMASDPDGDRVSVVWDFGNGLFGIGSRVTPLFAAAGEYSVVCEASDGKGGVMMKSFIARVGSPATYRLSGIVTRKGQPLPNARIYIPGMEASSGRTGADGRYVLTGLLPGSYGLKGAFDGLYLRPLNFQLPQVVPGGQEDLNWDCPRIAADDLSLEILEDSEQSAIRLSGQSQSGSMIFQIEDHPIHGVLAGTPPAVRYTPDANFTGEDFFTYYARDEGERSLVAKVSIAVQSQADAPVAFGQVGGRTEAVMTTRLTSAEGNIWPSDICAASNGRVYVFGNGGVNSAEYVFIRALDGSGNEQWNRTLNFSGLEIPDQIFQRRDGVVVTMKTLDRQWGAAMARVTSHNEISWVNQWPDAAISVAPCRGEDAFLTVGVISGAVSVAKMEGATGRELWRKTAPAGFKVQHVDVGDSGEFAATGAFGIADAGSGLDCATLKFSANGELLWARSFDKQDNEHGFHTHVSADGSVYVASDGYTYPNKQFAIWITHYSPAGEVLWQASPVARSPLAAPIVFDQEDIPHVLTVDAAVDNRAVLLRFKTNVAERLWVSTDGNSVWPLTLRVAAGGAFEAITADVLANPTTAWVTTIAPMGGELSHVRLRFSGAYWQRVIVRAAESAQSFFLMDESDGLRARIVKVVNDALPQTLTVGRDQSLVGWPAPIAIDDKPVVVEATVLPQHGTLSGVWPNWIYLPAAGYTGDDRIGYKAWHSGDNPIQGEFRIRVVGPLALRGQEGTSGAMTLIVDAAADVSWSSDLKEWTRLRGRTPTTLNFDGSHTAKFFRYAPENEIP